jgi:hypothetical protein
MRRTGVGDELSGNHVSAGLICYGFCNSSGSLAIFAAGLFFFSRRSAAFAVLFRNCRFAVGGQFVVVLSHASLLGVSLMTAAQNFCA